MTARELIDRWRRQGLHPCLFDGREPILLNLSGLDPAERREQWQLFTVHRQAVGEELRAEKAAAGQG